jgi:hypothetical protein
VLAGAEVSVPGTPKSRDSRSLPLSDTQTKMLEPRSWSRKRNSSSHEASVQAAVRMSNCHCCAAQEDTAATRCPGRPWTAAIPA